MDAIQLNRTPLTPQAGAYQTPLMGPIHVLGRKEFPGIVILDFLAIEAGNPSNRLSIAVPIAVSEAALLLNNLVRLQKQGRIPVVPDMTETRN
jgi:hypothetical protein